MNVADLDKCKELYELSGWDSDQYREPLRPGGRSSQVVVYDLGYLLRKLPRYLRLDTFDCRMSISSTGFAKRTNTLWFAEYENHRAEPVLLQTADTPEDAAAKLAIELFKQGVLKKDLPADWMQNGLEL